MIEDVLIHVMVVWVHDLVVLVVWVVVVVRGLFVVRDLVHWRVCELFGVYRFGNVVVNL